MSKTQNYYQILGISPSATLEEIRKAYHRLARQYHPDVNPDRKTADTFKEITRIYEILTDPIARRDYDQQLAQQSPPETNRSEERQTKINSEQQAIEFYQQGWKQSQKLNYQEAIANYSRAIELNPQLVAAYYHRGFARSQVSNDRGAFADYTAALNLNRDLPEIYYYRGLTRFKLANLSGSLDDFDRAVALKPNYAEAYYQRGLVYQEMKDKLAAIADFRQALQAFSRQGDRFNYRRAFKALETSQKNLKIIDKTPPGLTLPLDIVKTWSRFAFNPIEGLFPAFIALEPARAIAVAVGFALIFNLCFTIGISHWQSFYPFANLAPLTTFTLVITGFLPVFSLTGTSGIMRIICAAANGSFAADLFIATSSLLPWGIWVLLGGLIRNWWAIAILGVFAINYSVLTIYIGCHQIFHLSAAKSSLTVPLMLLLGMLPLMLIF